jgi:hypothetical protein
VCRRPFWSLLQRSFNRQRVSPSGLSLQIVPPRKSLQVCDARELTQSQSLGSLSRRVMAVIAGSPPLWTIWSSQEDDLVGQFRPTLRPPLRTEFPGLRSHCRGAERGHHRIGLMHSAKPTAQKNRSPPVPKCVRLCVTFAYERVRFDDLGRVSFRLPTAGRSRPRRLRYHENKLFQPIFWRPRQESNLRPSA